MSLDFSDLTAQIECRYRILTFLQGEITNPLLLQWLDIRGRYSLTYEQYEELSAWLKQECRRSYKASRLKRQLPPDHDTEHRTAPKVALSNKIDQSARTSG